MATDRTVPARAHTVPTLGAVISPPCRGVFFGTAGDAVLIFKDDPADHAGTAFTVPAGSFYPWELRKIVSAGTTVTQIRLTY